MQVYKKCCIDSCVWIKYAGHFKISTLLSWIKDNGLIVYADNYLLSEIHEALIIGFKFSIHEADSIVRIISPFIILTTPKNIYRLAPDPEDNYLYDLCIQNNCTHLITVDRQILSDLHAPFIRKTDAWLRKMNKNSWFN